MLLGYVCTFDQSQHIAAVCICCICVLCIYKEQTEGLDGFNRGYLLYCMQPTRFLLLEVISVCWQLKLLLDVKCVSSIATVHALQFPACVHLRHDVDAHRYLSRVFRGGFLAVLVLSLSSGQAIQQKLHRYALGLCMHPQSEHIAVVCVLLHLRAVHLNMQELAEGLDVLNGHHLLCSMQPNSFLLSEGISICEQCLLQVMQQTALLQCMLHR